MAEGQKRIEFGATDNGLSSFMKKIQEDAKKMYSEFANEAKKQANSSKEQFRYIQDHIKFLREQLKLEKELTQEKLRRAKEVAEDPRTDRAEKVAAKLKQQRLEEEMKGIKSREQSLGHAETLRKRAQQDYTEPSSRGSVLNDILKAGLIRDLAALMKQTATAQTEYDLITPAASVAGSGIGFGIGSLLGLQGAGGAIVGKEIAGWLGESITRSLKEQERYFGAAFRVGGLTGIQTGGGAIDLGRIPRVDLSRFGMDLTQSSQLEESIVRATGRRANDQIVKDVAAVSKRFTIDSSLINQFLGVGRTGTNVSVDDFTRYLAEGIDQSRLGDAIQNQTALMQQMAQTSLTGNADMAAQMMLDFNRIGGPFAVGDPRAAGFISTIQGNLTNPSSPFAQALSYSVLRRQNPNVGMLDLLIKRQQGGSQYLSGVVGDITQMGGGEDFQVLMLAQTLGLGGNLAAARKLLRGRGELGKELFQGTFQRDQLFKEAEALTPDIERSKAAITNAFIVGFDDGIAEIAERFTNKMTKAIDDTIGKKVKELMGVSAPKKLSKHGATSTW